MFKLYEKLVCEEKRRDLTKINFVLTYNENDSLAIHGVTQYEDDKYNVKCDLNSLSFDNLYEEIINIEYTIETEIHSFEKDIHPYCAASSDFQTFNFSTSF